jgi:outer membrane receptor protein involved in Fe transport
LDYGDGSSGDYHNLAPGGVFCDPQLGCSNRIAGLDQSSGYARQFSQEVRLQSDFDGPVNFSVGANYTKFKTQIDYYVFYNLLTMLAMTRPFNKGAPGTGVDITRCPYSGFMGGLLGGFPGDGPVAIDDPTSSCPYIDPNPVESINGQGHNYFRSSNPYRLSSWAGFGEVYWNLRDDLKVTAGLRYTDDRKTFTPVPSQLLLAYGFTSAGTTSIGYPEKPDIKQHWGEWTGRLGVDWKPDLSFTDDTLLYAFYSLGYKGGGANPPSPGFANYDEMLAQGRVNPANEGFLNVQIALGNLPPVRLTAVEYGQTFKPEFVNAFEVGAKNTLLGGGLTFNATAFYYDYKDYQVSQIRDRTAVNENFDATVWGLEFETLFAPTRDLRINANLGYMDSRIADGETSIDTMNRTQGNPNYVIAKPWVQLPSNCVVPVSVVENYLISHPENMTSYWEFCGGLLHASGEVIDPATDEPYDVNNYPELNGGAGLKAQLGGNELPNAPHWTMNIGAQYGFDILDGSWRLTVRGDAYWQSQSWARVYNLDPYDKLHGWYNANLSVWFERPEDDLKIERYAKNLLDDTPITDSFLNSDDSGLTTNVFTLDPRLIGLSIRRGF